MALSLPTFTVGRKVRASELTQLVTALGILTPLTAIKTADESITSSITMQNDDHLFLSIAANTNYWLDLTLLAAEATLKTADLKVGWTMPTSCKLDLAGMGPHVNWTDATQLEVEFAALQGQTSSPTATVSYGTINGGTVFSYHQRGIVRNGANAGTLQLQWAPNANVADAVTVKAGSTLKLTQLP